MTAPKRRWFRFSLRTMFVVVTVLAIWLGYHINWARQRRDALSSGRFTGDRVLATGMAPALPKMVTAPGLLWLLGEPGYVSIVMAVPERVPLKLTAAEQSEFDRVARLFPEARQNYLRWVPPDFAHAGHTER
jgi:hypothetical protein